MKQNDHLIEIIRLLYKKRKYILWTCTIATAIAIICSLLLPNYYQSSTTFYAASPDLAQPTPVGGLERKQEYYGSDTDLDRLFSLANSNQVSNYLIDKYNLYDHYEINRDDKKAAFKIKENFSKLFNTKKTKYDALELSIEDKDPVLATEMTNDARNYLDQLAQTIIKKSQLQLIDKYKENIESKNNALLSLNDSLSNIRVKYGVYNTVSQSEILTGLLANTSSSLSGYKAKYDIFKHDPVYRDSLTVIKARISGTEQQLSSIEKQLKLFNEGLAKVVNLEIEQREFVGQLAYDKERYKQLVAAHSSPFKALLVIEEASVPVVKSRPKRSLYVIGAAILSLVIASLTILLLHSLKDVSWKHEV